MDCRSPRVAGGPADVNTGLAWFLAGHASTCPVPAPCVALSMSVVLLGLNYCYKYRLSVKHGGYVYGGRLGSQPEAVAQFRAKPRASVIILDDKIIDKSQE